MLNHVLYAALRLAAWLEPFIPESFAYRLAAFAGTLSYYLFPRARRAILGNLAIAFPTSTPSERRHNAREAFRNDAKNWLETLRIARLSNEEILARVQVEGMEYITQAVQSGRGAILVSQHLGNFDLVGQAIAALGYPLTVPVEAMRPERLFLFLKRLRESKGIRLVAPAEAPRAMLTRLKRGELVGMTADRNLSGRGLRVQFFGREAVVPRGPAALALRMKVPILVCIGVRAEDGRFLGFVSPPLEPPVARPSVAVPGGGGQHHDENLIAQRLVGMLEGFILRFPGQWLAFTPLWPPGAPTKAAATIEQQKEAAI